MKKWLLSISLLCVGLFLMVCQSTKPASPAGSINNDVSRSGAPTSSSGDTLSGKAVVHGTEDQQKLDSIKRVKNAQKKP